MTWNETIWVIVGIYALCVNGWAWIFMGIDKWKAQHKRWRISEKMLFLPIVLGGALGGVLGMVVFRHKTNHWYFRYGVPLLCLIELAVVIGLFWYYIVPMTL